MDTESNLNQYIIEMLEFPQCPKCFAPFYFEFHINIFWYKILLPILANLLVINMHYINYQNDLTSQFNFDFKMLCKLVRYS